MNQFSKLPLLAVHYIDHWHRNHEMTLLDFFEMHYFGHDAPDNDSEQDKKLPLKSVSISAFQIFTAPSVTELRPLPLVALSDEVSDISRDQFIPSGATANIFRPPKA